MSYFLILAFLLPTSSFASSSEITKISKRFIQTKEDFFKLDLNKKNIKEKMSDLLKKLTADLDAVKKIEEKNNDIVLTDEGNQMALDLAILEPLEEFSQTSMSKQDCKEALHNNTLYESAETDSPKNRTKPVENVLKKICG